MAVAWAKMAERDGGDKGEKAKQRSAELAASQTVYDRDLTVALELRGPESVSATELMRAVRGL